MFDGILRVIQKMGRDLVGSGVMDVPLTKPTRLSVHAPSAPQNVTRNSNQKLAREKY